jgi:hypothetical protein
MSSRTVRLRKCTVRPRVGLAVPRPQQPSAFCARRQADIITKSFNLGARAIDEADLAFPLRGMLRVAWVERSEAQRGSIRRQVRCMADVDNFDELKFGPNHIHSVRFEPPDLVCVSLVGDVSGEDMDVLIEWINRAGGGRKPWFSMTNMSKMGSLTSEAKKGLRKLPPYTAATVVGLSVQARVALQLLNRAYEMWNRGIDNKLGFFDTEEDARAWIDEQRRAFHKVAK